MKSLKDVKAQLLANPAVRQAYDAQAPEFELARELDCSAYESGPDAGRCGRTHGASDGCMPAAVTQAQRGHGRVVSGPRARHHGHHLDAQQPPRRDRLPV